MYNSSVIPITDTLIMFLSLSPPQCIYCLAGCKFIDAEYAFESMPWTINYNVVYDPRFELAGLTVLFFSCVPDLCISAF